VIFPFSSLQCSSLENIAHTVMQNAVNVTKIFNEIICFQCHCMIHTLTVHVL
jgi:hypothetical protein